ncbi:MAG: AMP-binding protein [Alphaproteobacteria bacterium]
MPVLTYPKIKPKFKKEEWVLGKVLEHQAKTIGDKPFLQWGSEKPHSFSDVNRTVNRLAHGLAALGVTKGDTVVLFARNSLDYLYSWFALNKLGAIECPINTAYKGSFLEHQANLSKARLMILDRELAPAVVESEANMPHLEQVILWSPRGVDKGQEPAFTRVKTRDFHDILTRDTSNPKVQVTSRDLASIMFTSGTTGPSKGVMMPHAHNYFFSEECRHLVSLTSRDTYMTGFPFFHANAQLLTIYPSLIAGARCVCYERFSPSAFVDRLYESRCTVTNFLGVAMTFVYEQPPTPRDKGHKLTRIFAAPTAFKIMADFQKRFGIKEFLECYGMTEIAIPILTPTGHKRPAGACGVAVSDWFDIRVVNPDTDEEVGIGEVGEFIVRHKEPWTLNAGYFGMPEKTLEAYRNLWFHTGDAVKRDAKGWYYFLDRIKDALRRRGENISSYEVEAPILAHPAVDDCAVVGVPADMEAGEDEVKACVVLKPGAKLTAEELTAWCDKRMPYFVVPRYIEFYDVLPKTPTEKVQKAKLRAVAFTDKTWDRVKAGYRLAEEIKRDRAKSEARKR